MQASELAWITRQLGVWVCAQTGHPHTPGCSSVGSRQNPGSASRCYSREGLGIIRLNPASRGSVGRCKTSWLDSCFPSLRAPELLHWLIIQRRLALLLRGCLGLDVLRVVGLWGCCCSCPCSALPVPAVKPSRSAGCVGMGVVRGLRGALTERTGLQSTWHLPERVGAAAPHPGLWPGAGRRVVGG